MPRKIINISVPPRFAEFIRWRVQHSGYPSVSEYIRDLLRQDEALQIMKTRNADRRPRRTT